MPRRTRLTAIERVTPITCFRDVDHASSSSVCTNRFDSITRFITELEIGSVKNSGLGYKEGVQEAMQRFTNLKAYSLRWRMRAGRARRAFPPQPA